MRKTDTFRSAISQEPRLVPDLRACLTGDEQAWRQLLADYGLLVRKAVRWTLAQHAAKFAGPELEAEVDDVFQEVCYRLVRGEYRLLRTYDPGRASFATWLCVVARSAALDHLRNRTYAVQMTPQEMEEVMEAQEETGSMLSLPRELLSPRQAYVLHLLFEKDASTQEVAEMLDVHTQTVRSIRNAALARLRWHYFGTTNVKAVSRFSKDAQRASKEV